MKRLSILLPILGLAACGENEITALNIDPLAFVAASKDAERYLGDGSQVLAVCGGSQGKSYFASGNQGSEGDVGFEDDGISNGITVFAITPRGTPEILSRDVSKEMTVASEEGGLVARLVGESGHPMGTWTVQYPSTGVTISHVVSEDGDGDLVDLWVQNKPPVSLLPARASIFVSFCEYYG